MSALTPRGSTRRWRELRRYWSTQLPLPCSRCGAPVRPGDDWDLDHTVPRARGGGDESARPAHAFCNRSAGAEIRSFLRRERGGGHPGFLSIFSTKPGDPRW